MEKCIIINDYIENDPLSENNLDKTLNLAKEFRLSKPTKSIWLYTGFTFDIVSGMAFDGRRVFSSLKTIKRDIKSFPGVMWS